MKLSAFAAHFEEMGHMNPRNKTLLRNVLANAVQFFGFLALIPIGSLHERRVVAPLVVAGGRPHNCVGWRSFGGAPALRASPVGAIRWESTKSLKLTRWRCQEWVDRMGMKFEVKDGPKGKTVKLIGAIDETASLEFFGELQGRVEFDLSGVERINSVGINRWIRAFTPLAERAKVTVTRLSYPMALQAGALLNLFAGARVASTMAPYYCGSCKASPSLEVEAAEVRRGGPPPDKQCPGCGASLTFDELTEFLDFLVRQGASC